VERLYVTGFAAANDGGAHWRKRGVETPWSVQSADGTWWEIGDSVLTPQMFGAKGDGATDDNPLAGTRATRPLQVAADAAASLRRPLDFNGRTFRTTFAVSVPSNADWFGGGTIWNGGEDTQDASNRAICTGDWHPALFDAITAYALDANAGPTHVMSLTGGDASAFEAGQFVFVRSRGGYGSDGFFIPDYVQINQIEAIAGAEITLRDPVTEARSDLVLHAAEGQGLRDNLGYDLSICADAKISGIALRSDHASPASLGGAYYCAFSFPYTKGRNAAPSELFNCSVEIGVAELSRKLAEFAMGSRRSTVRIGTAVYKKTDVSEAIFAIGFGENTRGCVLEIGSLDLDEFDYASAHPIQFANASDNVLRVARASARQCCDLLLFNHAAQARYGSQALIQSVTERNVAEFGIVTMGANGRGVYFVNAGGNNRRNELRSGRFVGGSYATGFAVDVDGAGHVIGPEVYFDSGALKLTGTSSDILARGYFEGGVQIGSGGEGSDIRISSGSWKKLQKIVRTGVIGAPVTVTSTEAHHSVLSVTVPAAALIGGDHITIRLKGQTTGRGGAKEFRLRRDDTQDIMAKSAAADQAGYFAIDVWVTAIAPTGLRTHTDARGDITLSGDSRVASTGLDLTADALTLDIQAWVEGDGDTIVFETIDVMPSRARHGG
jgi:hypothetical protein